MRFRSTYPQRFEPFTPSAPPGIRPRFSLRAFLLAGLIGGLLPAGLWAVPYVWIPGSSQDLSPRTGNKMGIVDLGTRAVLGQFTIPDTRTGVDPLPTQFSPDGKYAYVICGGFDPDDPEDPETEDRTSRIFVYSVADVLAKISSAPETIAPLYPATIIPPNDGTTTNGSNTDEVFPTMAPDGSRLYIVSNDEEKLITYGVNANGSLTELGMIDTGQDPIRLDLNVAADRGYVVNYKDQTVSVYNLANNPPTLVTTVGVPQDNNNNVPLAALDLQGAIGGFPYPSGNTLLSSTAPVDDDLYLVYSGGFGPVFSITFPITVTYNYTFSIYALNTSDNTAQKITTFTTTGRTNEATAPIPMGFETVGASAAGSRRRALAQEPEIFGSFAGTHLLNEITPTSSNRRTINRPNDYIFLPAFIPQNSRTMYLPSGSDIEIPALTPKFQNSKIYTVNLDAGTPSATELATMDRVTCAIFGQDDADTLWVAGNDIYNFGAFSGLDLLAEDPRDSKIYWVTMGTGAVENEVTLPFAGGSFAVLGKNPPVEPTPTAGESPTPTQTAVPTETPTQTAAPTAPPTQTTAPTATPTQTAAPTDIPTATPTAGPTIEPTLEPTATPTLVPTQTPGPTLTPVPTATPVEGLVDTDGDGYSDEYETQQGTSPDDPADHPLLGDANGDGKVNTIDALRLYRWKSGGSGTGLQDQDCDGDGDSDLDDAQILYKWLLGTPGNRIIPFAVID